MNRQGSSLFLVTAASVLVVAQITRPCCGANSGGAAHTAKAADQTALKTPERFRPSHAGF